MTSTAILSDVLFSGGCFASLCILNGGNNGKRYDFCNNVKIVSATTEKALNNRSFSDIVILNECSGFETQRKMIGNCSNCDKSVLWDTFYDRM